MAIGTPTSLGGNRVQNASTLSITTTAPITAGSLVVVAIGLRTGSISVSSVSDGTNTYTFGLRQTESTNVACELWYVANAAAVGSSASLTANFSGSASSVGMYAVQVSGVATTSPLDSASASSDSFGSSPTVTTGTLSLPNEIVFGVNAVFGNGTTITYTESSGFTNIINEEGFSTNSNVGLSIGYNIVSATSPVTHSPSLSASAYWAEIAAAFIGAASSVNPQFLSLLGVGT